MSPKCRGSVFFFYKFSSIYPYDKQLFPKALQETSYTIDFAMHTREAPGFSPNGKFIYGPPGSSGYNVPDIIYDVHIAHLEPQVEHY